VPELELCADVQLQRWNYVPLDENFELLAMPLCAMLLCLGFGCARWLVLW